MGGPEWREAALTVRTGVPGSFLARVNCLPCLHALRLLSVMGRQFAVPGAGRHPVSTLHTHTLPLEPFFMPLSLQEMLLPQSVSHLAISCVFFFKGSPLELNRDFKCPLRYDLVNTEKEEVEKLRLGG